MRVFVQPLFHWRWNRMTRTMTAHAQDALSRFPRHQGAPQHPLPGRLIVSLTSHTPRFPTLPGTLKSLLDQDMKPDHTVLWIGDKDWPNLTPDILALVDQGLEIQRCEDLRSYTKLIHALERWPDAFIVTADDDQYYPGDWLRGLVSAHDPARPAILCRRALGPRRHRDGRMMPYATWERDVPALADPERDSIFPTGVCGVLYPPGALSPEVTDRNLFTQLAPTEDDLWFYWMGRRAGSVYRRIGPDFVQVIWPGSQESSLISFNAQGETDAQIRRLEERFGFV